MNYKWIVYKKNFDGRKRIDAITITPKGTFSFLAGFIEANDLQSVYAVQLLYSPELNKIGFNFSEKEEYDEGYYRCKYNSKHSNQNFTWSLRAPHFFRNNNLDIEKFKGKYDYSIDRTNNQVIYVIDLDGGRNE